MPQETNLNVSPYFDDFSVDNNYYKVLFKPGYPVQARELTTLQSIIQNQIEQFGKHIFKDGSPVIGGEINYTSPVYAIQINSSYNGVPIELYINDVKTVIGSNSGATAEVLNVIKDVDSEKSNYTLYVKYTKSGGTNFENSKFFENEDLITASNIVTKNNLIIQSGQRIFNILPTGGIEYKGSLCDISEGIFFIRGYFIKTQSQRIVTSQYDPSASYKVGFDVLESLVNVDEDVSLSDNASGFTNYSAPGADRFKLNLILTKKSIEDTNINFIELLRIENGQPQFIVSDTVYGLIRDELASRTYDESGNYFVNPFTLFVRECLNDNYKVSGLYGTNKLTSNKNQPSEDLLVYEIGAGKAYVNGYDVETISTTLIDVPKTRTTKRSENKSVRYNAGSLSILNNVYGSPIIGLGATSPINLMDSRLGNNKTISSGSTIGYARVYDFIPETQYIDQTSRMEIRLFDIDMFTKLTLTSNVTVSSSTRIEGKISKSSGFLKDSAINSNQLTLYSVSGTFIDNEPVKIYGSNYNGTIVKSLKYNFSDVKSLYSSSGISTFSGDFVLNNSTRLASLDTQFSISASSSGISTVTAGLVNVFSNKIKSGDIIAYNSPNFGNVIIYNKVESVSAGGTFFTVSGITTVSGVCDGSIPSSNILVNNISKIQTPVDINDSSLITLLPNSNVKYIDLTSNTLFQRRQFLNISFSNNELSISLTEPDFLFAEFDEDNFLISYDDGSVETLRSQMYSLSTDGKSLKFIGLSKSSGKANVTSTLVNIQPNSIKKDLNKLSSIIIDKSIYRQSGIGTTTLNDGLTYNQYYGLRVQDSEISLNVPDVLKVFAVYESSNTNDPVLPSLSLSSFSGIFNSTLSLKPGDIFRGGDSKCVAMVASILNSNDIEYINLNSNTFLLQEIITFDETKSTAKIVSSTLGSKNISKNYIFDDGSRPSIAEYSRIIRKNGIPEPKNKLRIIFQNYTSNSTDTGEFTTVNSYSGYDYLFEMPLVKKNLRCSDVIDLRPRVEPFKLTNKSPFEYNGRKLRVMGRYSSYVLVPNKNLIMSYDYYLPRVDVVSLNTEGKFEVLQGIPSDDPKPPQLKRNSLDIATIFLPAYLYSNKDAVVNMSMHKRYKMSDISLLERRIQNIEKVTSLSLLEQSTQSLTIKDAETGLNRFKSGFFADNFINGTFSDLTNPDFKSFIYISEGSLGPIKVTRNLSLQLGSESISGFTNSYDPNIDHTFVTDLGSPGVKKSGEVVTLSYSEVPYIVQQYANAETTISGIPIMYNGSSSLTPSQDTWYDEKLIQKNTFVEGTTTILDIPREQNITTTINQQGPDIIRYVDEPLPVYTPSGGTTTTNTTYTSTPTQTSQTTYEGIAGGVNQNAGYGPSLEYGGGYAAIGSAGVERALAEGYTISQIQDWVYRVGAGVGTDAQQKYGLISAR